MLERPDVPALLDALAKFLMTDLQPTVKDKKLAFQVLIAGHLCATLATQLRTQTQRRSAELERLRELLGHGGELAQLNAELEAKLKAGSLPEQELRRISSFLKESMKEALAVSSPAFDPSEDIE